MIKDKIKTKNDRILEKFLSANPGSLEYITLRSELKQSLTDPGILVRSKRTSEGLRKEARTILDAFEAITNGMYNPEIFTSLEEITEESIFYNWKELTLAIHSFYEKNYNEMYNRLGKIDPHSTLVKIKPILLHLSGISHIKRTTNKQKELIDTIIKDRSFIRSVISEIIESLEYDMEDLFLETAKLMLQDLNRNYKEPAYRFAIWSIKTASSYKYSPTKLISTCKILFGNTLAYRLTAIAMEEEEPDISLLFWGQSLLTRLNTKDLTIEETGAYFTIISRLAKKIEVSKDKFYLESLTGLIKTIKFELDKKFPHTSSNPEETDNPFETLMYLSTVYSSLEENRTRYSALDTSRNAKSCISTSNKTITVRNKPIQLSLFD